MNWLPEKKSKKKKSKFKTLSHTTLEGDVLCMGQGHVSHAFKKKSKIKIMGTWHCTHI